jgi:hypothetical protein
MTQFHHGLVKKEHAPFAHGLLHKSVIHPAGRITAIDEKSGLPIVRRDAAHSPVIPPEAPPSPIGQEEPKTGRDILHASNDPEVIQKAATDSHPDIKSDLKAAIKNIDGATLHGARDEKHPDRLEEKIEDEGQNPRTIPDYSGFRVAVDTRKAKDEVVAAIRKAFTVVREKDEFEKGAEDTAFHAHMMQVQDAGDPVTHEVQVLPKTVADNAEATHGLYEKARTGDKDAAAKMKDKNEAAWQAFAGSQGKDCAACESGDCESHCSVKSDDVGTSSPPVQSAISESKGGRGESPEQPAAVGDKTPAAQVKTGMTVKLPDGRTGTVKGISPKGELAVKLAAGGRVSIMKAQVKVIDPNIEVKGVTSGTPGHDRPTVGAVAVDLDRTMSEYRGYKGPTVIGNPIAPQVNQVKQMLKDGKDVWVYTARVEHPEAIPAIKAWTKEHIGKELPITNIKFPEFHKFIDDRAQLPVQMQKGASDARSIGIPETLAVHG